MSTELPEPASEGRIARPLPPHARAELKPLLQTLAALAARASEGADHAEIWLFDDARGSLRRAVRHSRPAGEVEQDLQIHASDASCFLERLAGSSLMAVTDTSLDPRTRALSERWFRPAGVGSALLAPCRAGDHLVALLLCGRPAPGPWEAAPRALAERVAAVVGAVVGAVGEQRPPGDRLSETLAREHRLVEQVLHQLPSGVLLADTHGRILLQNAQAERILGGRAPEDANLWDLRSAGLDIPLADLPLFRALKTGEVMTSAEFAISSRHGIRDTWLSVNAGPVYDDDGTVVAAVAAFEDVTDRRLTTLALEEEGRLRERFMAILGHDLRTPAAAILMSAQLLQRSGGLDAQQEALVQRIVSSGRRMERMIRELLDLGMIRTGRIKLIRGRHDLASLCEEVVDELRSTWPDRRIEVDLDAPAHGVWDAERLAQVLSNLVGNALAHGSPDHPVRLQLRNRDDEVHVEIRNMGPPIAPELVDHLFRPFHDIRTSRHSGLGLGLFISHAIVTAHGGTIALESLPPPGQAPPDRGFEQPDSHVVVTLCLPRDSAGSARAR